MSETSEEDELRCAHCHETIEGEPLRWEPRPDEAFCSKNCLDQWKWGMGHELGVFGAGPGPGPG